ncbi:MAG: acyl-CoA dehydrogenase family protein [Polyangiaceae bacterium]
MCALFREMGRSPVGARVFHCDAPDQGNMDLLLNSASAEVQERYLMPLVRGEITSAFSMTEPAPGAGADPSNLRTRAVKDGDSWVIDGHKWYTTGGGDAAFLIVMARTSGEPGRKSSGPNDASMFVVDRHARGVEHVRDLGVMAEPLLAHREAEMRFTGVRVPESAVLGNIGDGFRLAQKRLVPARLTHCMRWLGLADRTLEMCKAYVATRESFGQVLARHQMIQKMIAEAATAIHAGNLMTWHCAWMIENGQAKEARPYSSMAKTHVARTLCKVLDDAIQMHGGLGFSEDVPFGSWYRHARSARIADGPDEVHEVLIARDYLMSGLDLLVG